MHSWISAVLTAIAVLVVVFIYQIIVSRNSLDILISGNKTLALSAFILVGSYLIIETLSIFSPKLALKKSEAKKIGIIGFCFSVVHGTLVLFFMGQYFTKEWLGEQALSLRFADISIVFLLLGFLGFWGFFYKRLGERKRLYTQTLGYIGFTFVVLHAVFLIKPPYYSDIGKTMAVFARETEIIFFVFFFLSLLALQGFIFFINKNRSSLQLKIVIQALLCSVVMAATLGSYMITTDIQRHKTETLESNRYIGEYIKKSLQDGSREDSYTLAKNMSEATGGRTTIFFLSGDKIIIRHPQEKEAGSLYTKIDNRYLTKDNSIWEAEYKKGDSSFIDTIFDLGSGKGYVVVSADNTKITQGMSHEALMAAGLIATVTFISTLFIIMYTKRSVFNPIRKLTEVSQKIAKGNFESRAEINGKDEISVLSRNFNDMAATMQHQIEELTKVDRLKDEFIAIASHNLRTPLTTLRGYLDQLDSGQAGKLTEAQHITLQKAQEGTTSLISLAEGLLNITTLESKEMKIEKAEVDIKTLFDEMLESSKLSLKIKEVKIDNQLGDKPLIVIGDPVKLKQAFSCIIDNSIKFNKKGGSITIDKIIDQTNIPYIGRREVIVSVKDTGIGIKKEEQENIFKKFNRGTDTYDYEYKGVGLGLYLTRLIILAHRGKIWFESDEGKGTTFYISLSMK